MTPTSNVGQQFLGKYCCLTGFTVTRFHVYFVGIRSLFSFILLTYNFVIMLCIDIGYTIGIVWAVRFYFVIIQKVRKRILVVTKEHAKFQKNLSSVNFVDISYHYFITTHQNNLHN